MFLVQKAHTSKEAYIRSGSETFLQLTFDSEKPPLLMCWIRSTCLILFAVLGASRFTSEPLPSPIVYRPRPVLLPVPPWLQNRAFGGACASDVEDGVTWAPSTHAAVRIDAVCKMSCHSVSQRHQCAHNNFITL